MARRLRAPVGMALATYLLMAITYGYSVWLLWDQGRSKRRGTQFAQPASRKLELAHRCKPT